MAAEELEDVALDPAPELLEAYCDAKRRQEAGDVDAFARAYRSDRAAPERADLDEIERRCAEADRVLARLLGHPAPSVNGLDLADPADRYRVDEEVGRGGGGSVRRAFDRHLQRDIALKTPRADDPDERGLARFLAEARVAASLDHPGIAPIHDLGLDESGRLFFTMKLVEGRTLLEVIQETRTGDEGAGVARVLGYLLRVCDAMAYAHEKGVLHRDLKPSNVMVGRFGEVYVMDWGLARTTGGSPPVVRARPQSITYTSPKRPTITFDGFRSRCSTPFSWA